MNTTAATRNERWSANVTMVALNDSAEDIFGSNKKSMAKSSAHFRQILYRQDFGKGSKSADSPIGGSSSHTLIQPARRASRENLNGSMSSMSSMGSFGTRKSSNNSLLRFNTIDSNSMSTISSINNRWKLTTPPSIKKKNVSSQITITGTSPITNGKNQRRWLATLASDRAIDQPIGMITRKRSSSYVGPSSPLSKA